MMEYLQLSGTEYLYFQESDKKNHTQNTPAEFPNCPLPPAATPPPPPLDISLSRITVDSVPESVSVSYTNQYVTLITMVLKTSADGYGIWFVICWPVSDTATKNLMKVMSTL